MENQVRLPGQRFCPMDDELVLLFLKPALSGAPVAGRGRVVFDCDLYGDQEPWEIWEDFKNERPHDLRLNKDIYFFTRHKSVSKTDMRIKRDVGAGTWKGDNAKPIVSVDTGRQVGEKKRLTYKNEESAHNGCWILYEFFLDESLQDKKKNQKKQINKEGKEEGDLVLCLLRKNGEPKMGDNKVMTSSKNKKEEQVRVDHGYRNDDVEMTSTGVQLQEGLFLETTQVNKRQHLTAPCIKEAEVMTWEQALHGDEENNSRALLPLVEEAQDGDDDIDAFAAQREEQLDQEQNQDSRDELPPLVVEAQNDDDEALFAAQLEEELDQEQDSIDAPLPLVEANLEAAVYNVGGHQEVNDDGQQQQYQVLNDELAIWEEQDRNINAFFDSLSNEQIMAQLARRGMIFTSSTTDANVGELPNAALVDDGATSTSMQVITTMPNLTSENGSVGSSNNDGSSGGGVVGSTTTGDETLVMKEATTTSEEQQEQQMMEEDKEVSDWVEVFDLSPEANASFDFDDDAFRPFGGSELTNPLFIDYSCN